MMEEAVFSLKIVPENCLEKAYILLSCPIHDVQVVLVVTPKTEDINASDGGLVGHCIFALVWVIPLKSKK